MRPNWFSKTERTIVPRPIIKQIRPVVKKVIARKAGSLDFTPLTDETRAKLIQVFRADIEDLQTVTQRDLSAWL